ncbi:glycoside hydrolase family 92 protein, partial [Algoriphagus aestuarii]|nr:glycoside hydrolase family 92 protein [Algoriphagus aestuarii]
IQEVRLNGEPYTKSYISYEDLMKGGKLEFDMGNAPSTTFGVTAESRPKSAR